MYSAYFKSGNVSRTVISSFGGINRRARIGDGEFADMQNMSADAYPLLAPRAARTVAQRQLTETKTEATTGESGTEQTVETTVYKSLNGILGDVGFCAVWGTDFYYLGQKIEGLSLIDGEKRLAAFGANILIYPDQKYYNTVTGESGAMETAETASGSETILTGEGFAYRTTDGRITVDEDGDVYISVLIHCDSAIRCPIRKSLACQDRFAAARGLCRLHRAALAGDRVVILLIRVNEDIRTEGGKPLLAVDQRKPLDLLTEIVKVRAPYGTKADISENAVQALVYRRFYSLFCSALAGRRLGLCLCQLPLRHRARCARRKQRICICRHVLHVCKFAVADARTPVDAAEGRNHRAGHIAALKVCRIHAYTSCCPSFLQMCGCSMPPARRRRRGSLQARCCTAPCPRSAPRISA